MTKKAQEAYMRGFCKVAEAYGVDPHELIKVAVPLKALLSRASKSGYISPELATALTHVGRASPTYKRKMWNLLGDAHWAEKVRRTKSVRRANEALSDFFSKGNHNIGISHPVTKDKDFWSQLLSGGGFKFTDGGGISIGETSLNPFVMKKLLQ